MSMWKKFKLIYQKPLCEPKSLGKKSKNGAYMFQKWCDIKNKRFPWIPNSLTRLLCLKKLLSLVML
jgi:hypothetical protein